MKKFFCVALMSCLLLHSNEDENGILQEHVRSDSVESGLFFDFSYLFLKAEIDGLVYGQAIDVSNLTAPSDLLHVKDRPKNLDFQWSSGLTAGVGYIFPEREQFQLSAYWTYLHSKADKKTRQNGNIDQHFIAPNWLPFLLGSTADSDLAPFSRPNIM